jgi:hypothetical protein
LVRELSPYANNARTHSRKQVRQIANSIKRFGFNNPVLIDDKNQIVAGHGRVEAAKLLGLHAVPTVRLSHLSDADKRAYILADNKLAAKAGWDREVLAIELQGLIDLGVDVEVTGFETAEVDVILDDAREANDNSAKPEDETPDVPATAVTRPGDVWVLGQHRLVCGDCREGAVYQALLEGASAEFVFTDPPYNVKIDGNVCGLGSVRHREFAMASGEMSEAEFTKFLEDVFRQLALNTVDGSIHQTCMDWRHMSEMMAAGRQVYGEVEEPLRLEQDQCRNGQLLPVKARTGVRVEERHRRPYQQLRAWPAWPDPDERLGLCGHQHHAGWAARRVGDASNGEAGCSGRRRDQGLLTSRRAGPRPVLRQRHHSDCRRTHRP